MATKLGTLTLDLVAKIGRFVGPITDAESKVTKSFKKMREMVNQYGLVAVSAATAATTALIAMANTMAQQNNELERFAYLAQTSVGEFQKVAVGAQMMGIEMDKLSDIFKDWNERSGDFLTTGGGPLVDFMEQVAIKTEKGAGGALKLAKELSRLSGPESMGLFVKKMEEANLSQDQMSFMMESMASDSTLLLPLLKNNAEGFKLWGEAAERAGILMDEQTLKSSRELQVQTKVLEMQYEGLKRELLSAVIPALVSVSGAMTEGNKEARGMASAGEVLANSLRGVASIAVGVYATLNLIAVAMAGVTKSAVDSYNFTQKAAEDGSWWDKLPGVKLLKGGLTFGVTASADNSGIGMAVEDSKRIIEEGANTINGFFDNTTTKLAEAGAEFIRQANETKTAATKGTQDWVDKQNKATDATKAVTKAQSELNRKVSEQARLQESIVFEFSTDLQKMQIEYSRTLKDINEAGFSPELRNQYLAAAKARLDDEQLLFKMKQAYELSEFKLNEEAKAKATYLIDQQVIANRTDITTKEKEQYLASLKEKHTQELAWLELEKQQRLLDARQFYMSDAEYMQERYQLERDEIAKNMQLTQQERDARIAMNFAEEEYEKRKNLKSASMAWGQSYADMTGSGARFQLERDRFDQYDESQALFDAQMALAETAAEREAIWKAHNERMALIDQDYWSRTAGYQLGMATDLFGSLAGLAEGYAGKQSGIYRGMAAAQQAFSLFSVAANSFTAISAAWASAPFPANLGAVGTATLETGLLQAAIKALTPQGFANGGYTGPGSKYDPAGIVHRGEVVFSQSDVARWGGVGNVEAMRTGKGFADGGAVGTKVLDTSANSPLGNYFNDQQANSGSTVNINHDPSLAVTTKDDGMGTIDVYIRKAVADSWNELQNPNSNPSKIMKQTIGAPRRR